MKAKLVAACFVGIPVAVISILAVREFMAWSDCLTNNSFMFCWRILG